MAKKSFSYHCYVCGKQNQVEPDIPKAPKMMKHLVECTNCNDKTHILVTSCPKCDEGVKYFLSDLDFPEEVQHLAHTYIELIQGIKDSLAEYIEEFDVPLPKRWSVSLDCNCGNTYTAEIPLPSSLE
ncbi:MAG: hypothetical protein ACXAEF_02480 [Candidatus Thorarchaeota archaeon]|jgi:DNA-directed RNA polymerase subunit RPC12/RpoP